MNLIVRLLHAFFGYALMGIVGLICLIPCLLTACLPIKWRHHNRIYYWFSAFFFKAITKLTLLPFTVKGKENLPEQGAIIIANHQSALDIPFIGSVIGTRPHVWLFLKKYSKYPIFGFIVRRMNVVVDPNKLRKMVGSIEETKKLVSNNGRHIVLFPEGGRYIDGSIHRFFLGFALLAQATKRPVVPVLIVNLNKAYPPGSFLLKSYPVTLEIGNAFYMQEGETPEQFTERVRDWFVKQMATYT